ncbi:hypothetical protein SRB17_34050 [Streptomyces sp. RB17]|uniref:ABC transporter substrate-binding protein n=1 Tax=Streptomyces sp. RB17 TaxID=2585197 RepID=UPI001294E357|nr:ABC transporter substrate-binding protein [Streptomyces sp. RB17]MQY35427.1 hypothetical protein [Streptomyces sp. RB17]
MNNAKIGAAVLGGYVLGRTKKAKFALSLAALLAGSRIRPGQLVRAVQDSPFLSNITEQMRTELTGAGKAAATSVLTAKADSLADALHERTAGLHGKAHPDGERHRDEAEPATEPRQDESREDEEREDEEREDESGREKTREDETGRAETRAAGERRSEGHKGEARRSEGRARKTQHRESAQDGGEPRRRRTTSRTTGAPSRSKSGSA